MYLILQVLADNSDHRRDKTSPTPQINQPTTVQDEGALRMNVFHRTRVILNFKESAQVLGKALKRLM